MSARDLRVGHSCLLVALHPLARPGIEAWDNEGCRQRYAHRQNTLSLIIGLARRIMSKPRFKDCQLGSIPSAGG